MAATRKYDVAIIGAGMYGIQAARTYLEIYPDAKIAILEASNSLGGAWSKERVYDSLWTQDSVSIAEFSDVPIKLNPDELYCGLFKATHMTRYLEDYARSHVYAGSNLEDRVLFNSRVKSVTKQDDVWLIELECDSNPLYATKIIDASGITSEPELPNISKFQTFKGIQMHMKDLAASNLYNNPKCNRIAIIGGGKSGADAAYSAAQAGKTVFWIIRKSGNGPCYYAPAHASPPFKQADEPLLTRILYNILSSHFVKDTFFVRLLNRTAVGRSIIRFLWRTIEGDFRKRANYARLDLKAKENGFRNLEPDTPLFWANDNTGVEQREDFFDTISENVRIVREDVREMDVDAVVLADGQRVEVDTVIFGTGWKQYPGHYDERTALALGLPVAVGPAASVEGEKWDALEAAAEKTVLERFPILADPPEYFRKEPQVTPYRLYRSILPIHDHSIVFLGRMSIVNSWRVAESQCLWAIAALSGKIHENVSEEEMEKDVAETVVWCRKRYLNKGMLCNWFLWDCVAYTDLLLEDLGLRSHLGKEGVLMPCRAASLSGLLEEFKGMQHGAKS